MEKISKNKMFSFIGTMLEYEIVKQNKEDKSEFTYKEVEELILNLRKNILNDKLNDKIKINIKEFSDYYDERMERKEYMKNKKTKNYA